MAANSVFEVIAARYHGSAGLKAALPGGLVPGRARSDATGVRGTFNAISTAPDWTTESGFYAEPTRIQFSVFGPTASSVDAAIRALCTHADGFDRLLDVTLSDGAAVQAVRVSGPVGPMLDDSEGPGGARAWFSTADYLFHLARSL